MNFDSACSFGSYEGPLQQLIHLFKYAKVESLAAPLGQLLIQALPFGENFDIVIAMPMHWRKRWERGFNQAELLAEPVARRYGLRLANNLRRTRYTKSQAGLTEEVRRENLHDSFQVLKPAQVAGKRILLVDDVFTTGATLRAAAAALKQAGAVRVSALTLARADRAVPLPNPLMTAAAAWGSRTYTTAAPSSVSKPCSVSQSGSVSDLEESVSRDED